MIRVLLVQKIGGVAGTRVLQQDVTVHRSKTAIQYPTVKSTVLTALYVVRGTVNIILPSCRVLCVDGVYS
jgi:hypothetical protein